MMNNWIWAGAAVCLVIVCRCAARQRHPFLALAGAAICGVGVLAVLAILQPATGVAIPLNRFTGVVSVVLGVPGVILLLFLQLLM